jgi:histidinol-phosphate/aromatic aminotransferase/cobyric acid decarboxylase-like protein
VIAGSPKATRWWIDEAYLGYVDLDESLADLAATDPQVVVCTSLSKMYALSGMRVAYLVAEPSVAAELRRWTPPWPVSLPAQLAAVAALSDPSYYRDCWQRTHELRSQLAAELAALDDELVVDEAVSNFVTLVLPVGGPSAATFVAECRRHDVYLRDLSPMSSQYEGRTVRIAVKNPDENARIVAACRAVLFDCPQSCAPSSAGSDFLPGQSGFGHTSTASTGTGDPSFQSVGTIDSTTSDSSAVPQCGQ